MKRFASAWRAINLAAGLVPTFHRSRIFGLQMPWATILLLLIIGVLAIADQFDLAEAAARKQHFMRRLAPLIGAMLLVPAFFAVSRRVARVARPEVMQLVPGLWRDATFGLVANALMVSLLLTALFSTLSLKGYQLLVILLPLLLLSLVSDLPIGRMRALLWLLIFPCALCAVWLGSMPGIAFRPTDSAGYILSINWGMWMVLATVLGMVGLVYVKPFQTIGLGVIWIWLMRDPFALIGFNFNTVLGVTYEMFTQTGTHTLTAIAALGALWYWLLGRKADAAFTQRALEARTEGAFSGTLDLSRLAPSTWLLLPYRRSLNSILAAPGDSSVGVTRARHSVAVVLGPSLHWATLVPIAITVGLIWTAFLLAMPVHLRAHFASGDVTFMAVMLVVMMVDIAIKQYGKRQAEIDAVAFAPHGLAGSALRAELAVHAAKFVGTGIAMLALVIWVPRLLFGSPIENPVREFADVLGLLMIGICAFSLLLSHLLPVSPLSNDPGFATRAAMVCFAIMPWIVSRSTWVALEIQLLLLSLLLVGWGVYTWIECRRLVQACPAR